MRVAVGKKCPSGAPNIRRSSLLWSHHTIVRCKDSWKKVQGCEGIKQLQLQAALSHWNRSIHFLLLPFHILPPLLAFLLPCLSSWNSLLFQLEKTNTLFSYNHSFQTRHSQPHQPSMKGFPPFLKPTWFWSARAACPWSGASPNVS